ncbi:MAG: hypothetical protein Ta2A_23390 [Treponemataceae bacterium]|nr:MAG: hypothetical protein Ta2A_23390 [Treponemataceae bacterium]
MNTAKKQHSFTLMEHFSEIVTLSEKKGFTEVFWEKAKPHLDYVTQILDISVQQAALFAHFLNRCADGSIALEYLATSLHCNTVKLLCFMKDFEALEKKKLIRCCKPVSRYTGRQRGFPTYRVPVDVIDAINSGKMYTPEGKKNLTTEALIGEIGGLFKQLSSGDITFEIILDELRDLVNDNPQLVFVKKLKEYLISDKGATVLFLRFCDLFINENDDAVAEFQLEDIFDSGMSLFSIRSHFEDGDHILMRLNLVECTNADGYSDKEYFHLTDKAKKEFFEELDLAQKLGKRGKKFILSDKITAKELFFNETENRQIQELTALLHEDNFVSIQSRLSERGMRGGFACLFYGPPGTGKTETAYQIARITGRDILPVDISETKSHWFGDSEKAVKQLFDHYRGVVKAGGRAPILLFNEADAVIGKRSVINGDNQSVDKTINAIQNIILQEIETLEGILIAATNLETNMDSAFERRFLYKIKFSKPEISARKSIWQSIIPELTDTDAASLAERYDFSGGQIENIARKRTVECILCGTEPPFKKMLEFCTEETLQKADKQIGFGIT